MPTPSVAKARAKANALSRYRSTDDPAYVAARQELKAISLEEHIQRTVNSWPQLSQDQMSRLAGLFRTAGGGAA